MDLREVAKKKRFFFGRSLPNLFTNPPTPGFLWDLGERRVKFGSKKAIFGVIWGGLDLVWESATPPTHIWERPPKKTFFFTPSLIATKKFQSKPICPRYSQCISLSQIEGWNLTGFQSWSLQPANKVVKAGEGGGRLTIQSQLWQIIFCQNNHSSAFFSFTFWGGDPARAGEG